MMKNIKILLFFTCFFNIFSVNADKVICDSGNIDFDGTTVSDICNGGYMTGSIESIDSFTGSFINLQTGFWGTNNNYDKNLNIEENFPIGEFTQNKKTKVNNTNPDYTVPTGYIGTEFNYTKNIDETKTLPNGFFDSHKTTYITKENPEYTFPVGYLGNIKISKGGGGGNTYVKQHTYKEYFEEIFRNYSSPAFATSGSSRNEYNNFIDNLLELLINNHKDQYKIIDDVTQNRIQLHVEKNEVFRDNLELLVKNLRDINEKFKKSKTKKQKLYILREYIYE